MKNVAQDEVTGKTRREVTHVKVSADQSGRRIDNFLTRILGDVPRSRIYQMLRKGEVRVNGKRIRQDYRVEEGDEVRVPPVTINQVPSVPAPRNYLLDRVRDAVLHEDADLIVINKPPGLVVHGGSGRSHGVIELLRILRSDAGADLQLAHRLDRETSGLLLIAKNQRYLAFLNDALKDRRIGKYYQCLLKGKLRSPVTVDAPLARNLVRAGERVSQVHEQGKASVTIFRPVRCIGDSTLMEVELKTGRTHQIRVHAASIGHPLAGDEKYGDDAYNRRLKRAGLRQLFLHAARVEIPAGAGHPALAISAPLPLELADFLRHYGQKTTASATRTQTEGG